MTTAGVDASAQEPPGIPTVEPKFGFSKRDYVLLPLLSLLTASALFAAAEIGARFVWPEDLRQGCFIDDPTTGSYRGKPNCVTIMKNAEGPWVTYQYNECGYRTPASCGPKLLGHIRVALLGSSTSLGQNIPNEKTFAQRAALDLSRESGHPVEIENLGFEGLSPLLSYRRLNEALSLHPDVVIYPITPFDLEQKMDPSQLAARNDPRPPTKAAVRYPMSPMVWVRDRLKESRALLVAQHFLFSNAQTYLSMYMNYGDKADILRIPLSQAWQQRFSDLDLIIADMSARLREARVPLVLMAIPTRSEAALANRSARFPHTDAFTFSREIGAIAARHGAVFVDGVSEFSHVPESENFFYIVDGHLDADGQALLSRALVRKCLDGSLAIFRQKNSAGLSNQGSHPQLLKTRNFESLAVSQER